MVEGLWCSNGPKVLLVFVLVCMIKLTQSSQCQKNGTICLDTQNFQECLVIDDGYYLIGNSTSCPQGQICDDSSGKALCRNLTIQLRADISVQVPTCTGAGKYPAPSCYQYYECVAVMWYWSPDLKSCVDGQAFDTSLSDCAAVISVNCDGRTTTPSLITSSTSSTSSSSSSSSSISSSTSSSSSTTVASSLYPVPTCTGSGRYPAESCYQYYECTAVMWWWEPQLLICIEGYAYDTYIKDCLLIATVDCTGRLTTGVSPTTTTTTAASGTTPKTCTTAGDRFPADSCYQYYECVSVLWSLEPQLQICVEGYAYDIYIKQCLVISLVDCQDRFTTTMSTTSTTTTLVPLPPVIIPPTCSGPGKYPAQSCYEYYDCQSFLWWWEPKLLVCVEGYAFDVYVRECLLITTVDCQQRLTTTTTTTTTLAPLPPIIIPPTCSGPGKYPAESCYEYYDCQSFLWWWEPKLLVCVEGYAFDVYVKECILVSAVDCQQRSTTTLSTTTTTLVPLPPIIIPPSCSGPGRYPAESCYEYYECQSFLWWWEPKLMVCLEGYAFDVYVKECFLMATVDCQQRLTTTISTTSTTTTLAPLPPVINPPSCSGPGRYPSQNCYQYYECVPNWWWWEPQLISCQEGWAFNIHYKECLIISFVDCQDRISTTISTTTTTTIAPLPPVTEPSCSGPDKYPTENCYKYYECQAVFWWWEPKLLVCTEGYAFDVYVKECRIVSSVDCQNRWSTTTIAPLPPRPPMPPIPPPVCYGSLSYATENCYEYYECVQVWWWWEPRRKSCEKGKAFDIYTNKCQLISVVDCQHRWTISKPQPTTTPIPLPPIISEPTCIGTGRYPAQNCNQYYECLPNWWWWEPKLISCQGGCAFDIHFKECLIISFVDCQNRDSTTTSTTTTTVAPLPPITEPICTGPEKYPAENCYQYYECQAVLWWWEPKLLACVEGYAFDVFLKKCLVVSLVDCHSRWSTTTTAPLLPKPPMPPIAPPACYGSLNYATESCYEYYECVQVWWWWEPRRKSCKKGYAFDIYTSKCRLMSIVHCQNRWSITKPPTTTTTLVPLPPITEPICTGAGRYPAKKCNEYYECQSILWWWVPKLLICQEGLAFDLHVKKCLLISFVDCHNRITTTVSTPKTPTTVTTPAILPPITVPTCTGPGKHPAEDCYQYYECQSVLWWWEPTLLICERDHAFDVYIKRCLPISKVDCQHRFTVTHRPPTAPAPSPPISLPICSRPGKHPAPICYQYYECVSVWWWFEPRLRTCPLGEAFDVLTGLCYPIHHVNCQQRITTTVASPIHLPPTPPTPPSVSPPTCYAPSKHRAPLCYQYYECSSVWWWYEAQLKTCPNGQGYDGKKKRCVCAELIGCKRPIEEPECDSFGRYPARKCNQYYECVQSLWWWTPQLKDCPKDHGFDESVGRCAKGFKCKPHKP